MLHPYLQTRLPEVIRLMKSHGVKRAYAFGSVCTEYFNDDESDIDFLVEFEDGMDPVEVGRKWWDLYEKLQDSLQRSIDLLINKEFRNPYFNKALLAQREFIYG